jgi:hypothetical protein
MSNLHDDTYQNFFLRGNRHFICQTNNINTSTHAFGLGFTGDLFADNVIRRNKEFIPMGLLSWHEGQKLT